jgi:phosphoglucosamine mutase
LTRELVERLGRASTLWTGAGRALIGRDTRASGVELEEAFVRGVVSAGGSAVLGGVLPTPAVALLVPDFDLGVVISASHNPPEYNGVKFFDGEGRKLTDQSEEQIESLLAAPPAPDQGSVERIEDSAERYLARVLDAFGSDLAALRIAVDCANGAYSDLAPRAFEQLGAQVVAMGNEPDGTNINVHCGATDMAALQRLVVRERCDLGIAFDGDGDRMLAVDERGDLVDGDQIVAVLALHRGVDTVAVTQMTNLGFHALMRERGIRVVTTDVGDRYVLEALWREGAILGGEQSGHIIWLDGHVTGDGLASALLLCTALEGRTLSEAAAVMPRYPQARVDVPVKRKELTPAIEAEVERIERELDGSGRVLVRASGTEPLIRVLAEAENPDQAAEASATIAALVREELG